MNEVDHNVIKLKLFPFSLKDKEESWFHNLSIRSINTWGEMVEAFFTKFFPPHRTSQFWVEITQLRQGK